MDDFFKNIWVITIGGGALAALLAALIMWLFKNKTKHSSPQKQSQNQSVVVNVNTKENHQPNGNSGVAEATDLKSTGRILFIDDLDLKSKIRNLYNAGWVGVSQIKNAKNLDQQEIRDAEVIFVDYKGIGLAEEKQQGLAVLSGLRQRYNKNKWLILYSAHDVPVDAFNRGADSYLAKNSSIYELEQKILEGLKELRK